MRFLQPSVVAVSVLSMAAGVWAQKAPTPEGNRPTVIYVVPQPGGEQLGPHGASFISGPISPYVVVPADEIEQQYSCVIRVDATSDSASNFTGNWMDSQSAVALLTSSALIDPAVHQVLDLSPAQRWANAVVNVTAAGPRLARVEVILRKSPDAHYPENGAQKTVAALIDRLKSAYQASNAAGRKASEARIKPIAEELAATSAKLIDLRGREREIRNRASTVDPSGVMVNQSGYLSNLRNQRGFAQSGLAQNQARLNAMQPPAPDTAKWEQTVKTRQKQVDDLRAAAKQNQATADQVQDAESKLADAQAELAQASQPQATDNTNPFQKSQIAQLKATVAEGQARVKQLDDQIAKASDPKFLEEMDSLPDLQNQENQARNRVSELQMRLDAVRRSVHEDPEMSVTVLDGSAP